ncbi:MAG: HNH endonuclease [Verrucomicrobia bacterium]|nr:HNH endonuclease [Verrucomicrobiota bacterium]
MSAHGDTQKRGRFWFWFAGLWLIQGWMGAVGSAEPKPTASTPAAGVPATDARSKSLETIAREYFEAHPDQEISQEEITAHIRNARPDAQDPWRTVRKLYQDGYLQKVRKGVYKRVPGYQGKAVDEHFSEAVRKQIYERDRQRCVVCGNGPHNGYEIHADHIRPRQLGGLSIVENGQTLCSEHNLLKKTYGTYDFYAHLVKRLEQEAKSAGDDHHAQMLGKVLAVLREYGYPSTNKPPQAEDSRGSK